MEPRTFAEVSSLTDLGDGRFGTEVDPDWTIGGKPNGGYLLAVLGRAAGRVAEHPHPIAASAHYLRSPDPGPVVVEAEVARAGRTASQVRARMVQDGRVCVESLVTVARLETGVAPFWDRGVPDRSGVAFEECTRLHGPPGPLPVAMLDQVDIRLLPDTPGIGGRPPSGTGELRGWLALPEGERFDPVSLLYAVDAFPPATFDIEFAGWVPTLELTVYVRSLPAPGPVEILQKAHLIEDQRVDEICFVWDTAGRLVAHGTQLAGIRLG